MDDQESQLTRVEGGWWGLVKAGLMMKESIGRCVRGVKIVCLSSVLTEWW